MATSQGTETGNVGDLSQIKRKLAWRMGIAGLMIIGLLGGLAFFDYLTARKSEQDPSAPQFTEPVPVARKSVTQPLTPAESPADQIKQENTETAPEATSAPVDKAVPPIELPPPPEVAAQPSSVPATKQSGRTLTPPGPVYRQPKEPVVTLDTPRRETPSGTSVPQLPSAPVLPRLLSGFVLQAGVFADPLRAEELHVRLTLEGIPSTIEAKVQVGPFKSRAEAEAARAKMKALGIDSVLHAPKSAR